MNLIKTAISLIMPSGTYPVYYCELTERHFIKQRGRLLEVKHRCVCEGKRVFLKWRQTGVQMPSREVMQT